MKEPTNNEVFCVVVIISLIVVGIFTLYNKAFYDGINSVEFSSEVSAASSTGLFLSISTSTFVYGFTQDQCVVSLDQVVCKYKNK